MHNCKKIGHSTHVRSELNNSLPVMLFAHFSTPDLNNHAVVAYGYNGSMFIVHSGYKQEGDSKMYVSSYFLGSYMTLEYIEPASC